MTSSSSDADRAAAEVSRWARRAAFAWLTLLGVAAMIVGGHDTAVGREIAVRLTGTAVLAAGVVLVAGALGLRGDRPQGRALASVAALLGAALGVITFLAQAVNDDPDSRLVLWGAIIVLSVAAWAFIRSEMTDAERGQGLFTRLPALKSVLSLGLLFSIVQFWYNAIYLPTKAPVSVTVEAKFESPEPRGERIVVRGNVTVRNTSSTRVIVLASSLMLSGNRVSKGSVETFEELEAAAREADAGKRDAARFYPFEYPDLRVVSRGRFVSDDTYFEPGETTTLPFIAWYPREARYDLARVDVSLVLARPTVGELRDDDTVASRGTAEGTVVTRPVPEDGWLRGLTRGDRFMVATYYDDPWDLDEGFTPVYVGFDRTRSTSPPDDFSDRMRRFYGVNVVGTRAVVPLPGR